MNFWQRVACRLGFHIGAWGRIFRAKTINIFGNGDRMVETFEPRQARTCDRCGAINTRKVR